LAAARVRKALADAGKAELELAGLRGEMITLAGAHYLHELPQLGTILSEPHPSAVSPPCIRHGRDPSRHPRTRDKDSKRQRGVSFDAGSPFWTP